jgi:hypothetical protein
LLSAAPPLAVTAVGVGHIFTAVARPSREVPKPFPFRCFAFSLDRRAVHDSRDSPSLTTEASGVGHNEYAVAFVWGTDRGRRHSVPFRIEPEAGQVAEYFSELWESKESCWVLQQDPAGSYHAKKPCEFGP